MDGWQQWERLLERIVVDRQEDADQKIEQDANKPEDKAHKAATKIQASFRGHIIRKKMKGDQPEADIKANGEAVDNKPEECKANKTQEAPCDTTSPKEEQKQENKPHLAEKPAEEKAPSPAATPEDKKTDVAKPESTTEKGSNESLLSSDPSATQAKAESKQADVPAECDAKEDNTAKEQEKTEKETTSPVEAKQSEKAAPEKLQLRLPTETTLPAKSKSLVFSEPAPLERSQSRISIEAVEETKPTESAQQENAVAEENKADQENA